MRIILSTVIAAATIALSVPVAHAAQAELDRLLVRVNGSVLTQSDVRQARGLKLVPDTNSDESTQRGLENRLLMIAEVGRLAPGTVVSEDDMNGRRQRWQAAVGGDADALLARHAMSRAALDDWLRDDAKVDNYVKATFGDQGDASRARATAWVDRLRQRAGLR